MFIRHCYVVLRYVLRYALEERKIFCGEEEILLFDHGKVRASSDRRHKPPLRPLLVVLARYTEMRYEIEGR